MSRFKTILIVTYGRSGSTLLQGILNTIPGFLVRGENYSFVDGLYRSWKAIEFGGTLQAGEDCSSPAHSWYGIHAIDRAILLENLTRTLRDILVPDSRRDDVVCYGFKEIRFVEPLGGFDAFVDFHRLIMPDLAVILNTRSLDKIVKSGWWAKSPSSQVMKQRVDCNGNFAAYAASHPEFTFEISYEDVVKQTDNCRALFTFLGVDYPKDKIEAVLAVKHGVSKPRGQRPQAPR